MHTLTPKLPSFEAPVDEWIAKGLATRTSKAASEDLKDLTFDAAQSKKLVFLTGRGALALEREGLQHTPTETEQKPPRSRHYAAG
jgi:hypothetical protein